MCFTLVFPRTPLPSRSPHPFRYKTTGSDIMRLYAAVLRAIVGQQFFIIRICRFSARRDAGWRSARVRGRCRQESRITLRTFYRFFPPNKGFSTIYLRVRPRQRSRLIAIESSNGIAIETREKSLISQTLIKRHDNPRTRCWKEGKANEEKSEDQRGFIPDEAAEASEINTLDIFSVRINWFDRIYCARMLLLWVPSYISDPKVSLGPLQRLFIKELHVYRKLINDKHDI